MKHRACSAALVIALGLLWAGCAGSDEGGSVSGSAYYGVGFHDPWYYGDFDYDGSDIIVTPPDNRPDPSPVKPTQPIARPPAPAPRPMPIPSIPSMPRVSTRR